MIGLSRRVFLKRGSMAVAMAGVATSMPLLSEAATGAPASEATSSAATEIPAGWQMTESIVAHVKDLGSGDIALFVGERRIDLKDPGLAHAIARATR